MRLVTFVSRRLAWLCATVAALTLAACAPETGPSLQNSAESAPDNMMSRASPSIAAGQKLGTEWGEDLRSKVSTVRRDRKDQAPLSVTEIRYSAAPVRGEKLRDLRLANGAVAMRVLRAAGGTWPLVQSGGTIRLQGSEGARYTLEYRNLSRDQSYEIVATVDGLDVLSGQAGRLSNRGYILRPGETVGISGYRKSQGEVAAFRFSAPADAYAANTPAGSPRNIGVIGSAVFAIAAPPDLTGPPPPASCGRGPCAFPGEAPRGPYAQPPVQK